MALTKIPGSLIEASGNLTITDLTVTGDLSITGDLNSYNVTDLDVVDQTITLGAGQTEELSGGSGIIIDGSNASLLWDETNTSWDFNESINVTGTVTADGLTVDGTSDLNGNVTIGTSLTTLLTGNDIDFQRAGDSYLSQTGGGALNIRTNDGVSNKVRLNLATNGDISFYEDTGTTAKLFWDASAESLGIGTTSVDSFLTLDKDVSTAYDSTDDSAQRSSTNTLLLKNEDGTVNSFAQIAFDLAGSGQSIARIVGLNDGTSTSALAFVTEGSNTKREVMRLEGNGNVGIGETNPETSLHIKSAGNSFLTLERSGTTGGTGKFAINMEGGSSQQTTMAYDDGGKLVIGRSSDPATQAGFSNDFILKGGFVGIKTLDPQVELHVTGNANISGSTTSGGVITANHIIRSDAGHNTARVEAMYDDNSAQYDSNILMWVSEPGYTFDSGGIGVNVHESGHYYGRKYDNDYAVFMRFIKSDGSIQFAQNQGTSGTAGASQTETLKITANGTLRLATTGGIGFGTTNADDTLDDYEEGTFSPTLANASNITSLSLSEAGRYVKIGNLVHFECQVEGNITSASSEARFSFTLPFNTATSTPRAVGMFAFLKEGTFSNDRFSNGQIYQGTNANSFIYVYIGSTQIPNNGGFTGRLTLTYQSA